MSDSRAQTKPGKLPKLFKLMMTVNHATKLSILLAIVLSGCEAPQEYQTNLHTDVDASFRGANTPLEHPPESAIYDFANACVLIDVAGDTNRRVSMTTSSYEVSTNEGTAFFMKASDLGTYLFYDQDGGYIVSEDGPIIRQTKLKSDLYLLSDTYISGAEWILEFSERRSHHYQLRHRRTDTFFSEKGLVDDPMDAAALTFTPTTGCLPHPEMALNATGEVEARTWPDGDVWGYVDTHSHILSNFGFGGGGIFHGASYHRLGVEHAMGDCELFHAEEGRADFLGAGLGDDGGELNENELLSLLSTGRFPEPLHNTDGWPTFSDWPSQESATHQTQYYRWLERAWMSGLRLIVQHMVSNEAYCRLMGDTEFQPVRWDCPDMFNIDRQLVEVRRLERYIDAQSGGPGEGWFRIVETPAQARAVIEEGKLAIILGIEVPNLFDCYLTPRAGSPNCDTAHIEEQLDKYYGLGIRVLFPNHKFDNAFTPGDGHKGIIELGNFLTTAHWSNFVEDCPDVPHTVFDKGSVQFGGFNEERDEYASAPPNEILQLTNRPLNDLLPYLSRLREPPLPGEWCQKTGLTDAGETLIHGMMARGMIPEIDHLPRRSYLDVFQILEDNNYPAAGTHGNTNAGKLYEIGGISKANFRRCADPANPGSMFDTFRNHRTQLEAADGYLALGFGFDLNGLAGVPNSRFGPDANCADPQENPVEYPFTSFGGDVTFEEPFMGERAVDFNMEGMIHIGLVPELIEDARRTGVTDADLEFLFRSAEGYIRVWELAEERSKTF